MKKIKLGLVVILVVCLLAAVLPAWALTSDINSEVATASETSTVKPLIKSDTVWKYLDDGTDPAGDSTSADYNSTSWTLADFNDDNWSSCKDVEKCDATFGSKYGILQELATGYTPMVLLKHYKNGSSGDVIPAYFFRTTVTLDREYSGAISGTVLYDDSAIVYINGTRVAGFDDSSLTGNLSYGGSNSTAPKTGTFSVDAACLKEGTNIIAVEVHNGKSTSSDEWFSMPEMSVDESVEAPKEKSICITVGEDETARNITWYSPYGDSTASVQYAPKGEDDTFPSTYNEAAATVKTSSSDGGYYYCQTTMTDLAADTEYIYRFKNGSIISDTYTFSTGADGSFSFIFVGDPQIGASGDEATDGANWADTLDTALTHFPDASFLVSAGDQVNTAGSETEYAQYLSPEVMSKLTTATVVGNHDTGSAAHSRHFYDPNTTASNGSVYGSTSAGSDYWYIYNNVLFMNLNTNNVSTAEHKAFMEDAIAQNPHVLWRVVVFHHSIYSAAGHAVNLDVLTRREELVPVFTELDIDVVLMGHDHVYVRSYMMDGFTPDTSNGIQSSVTDPSGILYLTACSSTGSKYYSLLNSEFEYAAVKIQENTPNYANIEVTPTSFKISTYRSTDSSLVDEFEIKKTKANATEHSAEYIAAKAPTCTETGNTAYYDCKDCGRYYEDEACTSEITDKTSVVIAATGHLDVSHFDRVPANCLIDGNIEYWHCNVCDRNYKDSAYTKQAEDVVIHSRGGHSGGETYYNDEYHWTLCEYCAEPYNRKEHLDDCDCGYTKP